MAGGSVARLHVRDGRKVRATKGTILTNGKLSATVDQCDRKQPPLQGQG